MFLHKPDARVAPNQCDSDTPFQPTAHIVTERGTLLTPRTFTAMQRLSRYISLLPGIVLLLAANGVAARPIGDETTEFQASDTVSDSDSVSVSGPAPESKTTQLHEDADLDAAVRKSFKQQDFREARSRLEELLELRRRTFPKSEFPRGHARILNCLNGLATVNRKLDDHAGDLRWNQEALAMCRQLYPTSEFPQGHIDLANALNGLGLAHYLAGDWDAASGKIQAALQVVANIPHSSTDSSALKLRASILANLGHLSNKKGKYADAHTWYEELLRFGNKLYPQKSFPNGHATLSLGLLKKGHALRLLGNHTGSRTSISQAFEMNRKLYPETEYPLGHSSLADALRELALTDLMLGDSVTAKHNLEQAFAMEQRLILNDSSRLLSIATILDGLLMVAVSQCRFRDAKRYGKQIELVASRLYPAEKYPDGHGNAASFSLNIGLAYQKGGELKIAEEYYQRSLAVWGRLYQKDHDDAGHPKIIEALYYLGNLYQDMGKYDRAYAYYDASLKMARSVFPKEQFPDGNELLSAVLQNMANHCIMTGEVETAAAYFREVLRMNEALYPVSPQYPGGHPILQETYKDWADFLTQEKMFDEAEHYYRRALAIAETLYPVSAYPNGHPDLASGWTRLGNLRMKQERFPEARTMFEKSLACHEHLLAGEEFSSLRPIALALSNIGQAHHAAGDYDQAESHHRRSLAMCRRLFPDDVFKSGHPVVATRLYLLGQLLCDKGDLLEAFSVLAESVRMERNLVSSLYDGASDAQLLNFAAKGLCHIDRLLSVWQESGLRATDVYAHIWRRRGLVQRLIANRQRVLKQIVPETDQRTYEEYVSVRRGLSRALSVATASSILETNTNLEAIRKLNTRKEELERHLGRLVSQRHLPMERDGNDFSALTQSLPDDSVFIDFLQYAKHSQAPNSPGNPGHHESVHLAAFLLVSKAPVRFVDLGDANIVEGLITTWRKDLLDSRRSSTGHQLRRRIWDPISQHLPDSTKTVYVCPDGPLSLVPWGALPCKTESGVLLNNFAFAIIPNGQMLLERILDSPSNKHNSNGSLLAVGNVDYGQWRPTSKQIGGVKRDQWTRLAGSHREVQTVVSLAKSRDVVLLAGNLATTERVLDHLPNVRWAHLATHGFYSNSGAKVRLEPTTDNPNADGLEAGSTRASIIQRNPYVQSGLILAGANRPTSVDQFDLSLETTGVLSAETIVSLDCRNLDLVVLSACETGLGNIAPNDGVFGMRSAFHIAGARNVIASLWRIEDEATTELMSDFYRFLWRDEMPPLEALRQAQLIRMQTADHDPAVKRGLTLSKTVPLDSSAPPSHPPASGSAKRWAGFILSGPGF